MIKRLVFMYGILLTPYAFCAAPVSITLTFKGHYNSSATASWSDQIYQNFSPSMRDRIKQKPESYKALLDPQQVMFTIVTDYYPSIQVELCNNSGGIISFRGTLANGKHYDSGWTSSFLPCFAVNLLAGTSIDAKWSTWKTKNGWLPAVPLPGKYQFKCTGAVQTTGKCRLNYYPA